MKFSHKIKENPDIKSISDNKSSNYTIVILSAFIIAGNLFSFDILQQLGLITYNKKKKTIAEYFGIQSEKEGEFLKGYNMTYMIFSIVFPLIGSYLLSAKGHKKILILFGITSCLGQFLQCISMLIKNEIILIIGRILYCFGNENLILGILSLVSVWLKKKFLSFSFSLIIMSSMLFYFLSILNTTSILVMEIEGINAMWIGFTLNVFSLILLFFLLYLDFKKEITDQIKQIYLPMRKNNKEDNETENDSKCLNALSEINSKDILIYLNGFIFFGIFILFNRILFNESKGTEYNTSIFINGESTLIIQFLLILVLIPIFGYISDKSGYRFILIFLSDIILAICLISIQLYPLIKNELILILIIILSAIGFSSFSSVFISTLVISSSNNNIPFTIGLGRILKNFGIFLIPICSLNQIWIGYFLLISMIIMNIIIASKGNYLKGKDFEIEENDEDNIADFSTEESQTLLYQEKEIERMEKIKEDSDIDDILKILNEKDDY